VRAAALAMAGPLASVAPFGVAALVVGVRVGTPILSYDDIYRTLFAHAWAREPYFFTERLVWLPFPLIVGGLAMRITGEAFWTSMAVDLVACAVAIAALYRFTAECFGRLAGWIAASMWGLVPWVIFLGLSRYGEPVFLAAAALGALSWRHWSDTGRGRDLAGASLALTAAVLTRYEAWPLAAALAAHAIAGWRGWARPFGASPSALWAGLPLVAMGVWVAKNLAVYGQPVYGGAFGFLPSGAPAGVWRGAWLLVQYLWQLSPVLAVLGIAGVVLHRRHAALSWRLAALSAIVPWYTVSLLPVDVALQVRLMAAPLMFLAPFAGALVAGTIRRRGIAAAVAAILVAAQLGAALASEYPSTPLPMTLLARRLHADGDLDRFDALYVQSATATGAPDEVRVGTNFRRPVHVLSPDPASRPPDATSPDAILILNDGRVPASGMDGQVFLVARVGQMTAWGVCRRSDAGGAAEWGVVRAPDSVRAGARATIEVALRNQGSSAWPANACGPLVELRWLRDGRPVGADRHAPLAARVEPGQSVTLAVGVEAPSIEGAYDLRLGFVERRSSALSALAAPREVPIQVTGR
jgi:hypothetical protein